MIRPALAVLVLTAGLLAPVSAPATPCDLTTEAVRPPAPGEAGSAPAAQHQRDLEADLGGDCAEVAREMVRDGYALDGWDADTTAGYGAEQEQAEREGSGLWEDGTGPVEPED